MAPKDRCLQPDLHDLVSYISPIDPLPSDFIPSRRGKLDAEDIRSLEYLLERKFKLHRASTEFKRCNSAPPELPTTIHLSSPLSLPQRVSSESTTSLVSHSGSQLHNFRSGAISNAIVHAWRYLREFLATLFIFPFEVLETAYRIFSVVWVPAKWPIRMILAVITLLQFTACAYSFTHKAFLSSFCPRKLALITPLLCHSWDQIQHYQPETSSRLEGIISPYETILRSNETTISYELPHFLRRWETTIRQFRAGLSESRFPPDKQQVFRDLFTEYIDRSHKTTFYAQSFHAHIFDTIRHHIGDTKSLTQKLDRIGFVESNTTILPDGPLAQSIGWLNTHYMVYLPAGIEPFKRPYVYVREMGALELLKSHVSSMSNRAYIDIDMVTVLQASMRELRAISESIETKAAELQAENSVGLYSRKGAWGFLSHGLTSQVLTNYEVNQRAIWLEAQRPLFRDAMAFHHLAASELQGALLTCQTLTEQLVYYGAASYFGTSAAEWIKEQARDLRVGADTLVFQLKNFKVQQSRFNDEAFRMPISDEREDIRERRLEST